MKPLKLVYIIGSYPQLTTTFIEREIEVLRQLGDIEVQTVSIRYPQTLAATLPEYKEIRESTQYLIPTRWLTFLGAHLYFLLFKPVVYFGTLVYLFTRNHPDLKTRLLTIIHFSLGVYTAYLLRHNNFDRLHAHFIDRAVIVALVAGRLLNKPYSLTAHANSIFVKKILIKEKIINAAFMVTVSEHNKAHLVNNYPGLDASKIHVLHPWVNMTHFIPPASRPAHDKLHILSVGRLVEKKGHIYLVEACHLLNQQGVDFECRIAGDGPLTEMLEEAIIRYNLQAKVYLLGGQPQQEIQHLLKSWADVFVLPCVIAKDGDRDGIPVALAEAMAMELPVISTNIVGISELVKSGAGLLVTPYDAAALADALQTINNTGLSDRAKMGCMGRTVVDSEFNLVKGTSQLANLFRENMA